MLELDEKKLAERLNARGYKLTQQRWAVLRAIAANAGYLNPAEVYERAKAACPRIGLTTVYRTLELFAELGAVRRVHLDSGCHSYALASAGHRHHLICSDCQCVVEFEGCDLSAVIQSVSEQTGFVVESHWLQLFGRCPVCQRGKKGDL